MASVLLKFNGLAFLPECSHAKDSVGILIRNMPNMLMYWNTRLVVDGVVSEGLGVESCWSMYVKKVFESYSVNPKELRRNTTDTNHHGHIN